MFPVGLRPSPLSIHPCVVGVSWSPIDSRSSSSSDGRSDSASTKCAGTVGDATNERSNSSSASASLSYVWSPTCRAYRSILLPVCSPRKVPLLVLCSCSPDPPASRSAGKSILSPKLASIGVGVKSLSIGLVEPCGLPGLGLYSAVVTFCKLGKRSCETAAGAALRSGRELLGAFAGSPPATPPPPPTAVRAGM
jgi:hypothetical protein